MSRNTIDGRVIEQRICEQYHTIATTLDQLHVLNQNDPNGQDQRDALTQKLHALHAQLDTQFRALEAYRQGKGVDFPPP